MKKALSVLLLLMFVFSAGCINNSTPDETTADKKENQTQPQNVDGLFPHSLKTDREPYTAVSIPEDPNDPYSKVIKKYYKLVLDESSDASEELKYYKYMLYDIDGDGTKELLLSAPWYFNENNTFLYAKHIFTLKNGAAIEVKGESRLWDNIGGQPVEGRTIFTNGVIESTAGKSVCYFRYEKGTLTYLWNLVYKTTVENNVRTYTYNYLDENGQQKSKEVNYFDKSDLEKELLNDALYVDCVWLPLESYGRFNEAKDYYSVVLKEEYDKISHWENLLDKRFFAFYDIDGNGTEELLFAEEDVLWGHKDPAILNETAERGIIFTLFFSFDGESVMKMGRNDPVRWDSFLAESQAGRDVLTNGVIRQFGGTPEYTSYVYFKYTDGKLEFIRSLVNYVSGAHTVWYNQNEQLSEDISMEEFERLKSEIEDGAEVVDIQWQTFKSYGDKND